MYEKIIKEKGLSLTKKRVDILRTLDINKKPLMIDDIKKKVKIKMDTSTIYRSLKVLVDSGLVYQTDFREGVSYFEFHGENGHHHHIICTTCKKRESIDICMDKAFPSLEKKTGYKITNHIFEIFGLCKTCLK